MRADAVTGEAVVGQIQLVRLPSSGGNTLFTPALQSDDAGTVYELQASAPLSAAATAAAAVGCWLTQ